MYGFNHVAERVDLWSNLCSIANNMEEAWCVIGDFNSVLYPGDRMGGTDIQDYEVKPFAECLHACDLHEMRGQGPYFTWTNKTV